MNQSTQCTVPGYAAVSGRANPAETVTVNNQPTLRHGLSNDWFHTERPVNNSTGTVVLGITNVAAFQRTGLPDLVTSNLTMIYVPQTPQVFAYDANGSLTNDGWWSYTWDAENCLTGIESTTNVPPTLRQKLIFQYDWLNRRVSKTVSNWNGSAYQLGYLRRFVWDNGRLQAELDATNNIVEWYLWGLDLSGTMDGAGWVGCWGKSISVSAPAARSWSSISSPPTARAT